MLANLELLSAELAGEQRETADAALRSSRRMRRLVADLLLLARADAGHEAPHRAVDLSQSLVDAAGELGPVASQHAIAVEAPEPAWVDGAPDELHQLVLNLLQNAVSHTQPGSRVTAQVRAGEETHELVVEDDGPGVPPELRERIFDRFVRAQGDAGGGTGLAWRSSGPWPSRTAAPCGWKPAPTARARGSSSSCPRRGRPELHLDDDRQHHRPALERVVDVLGEVVVQVLLDQVDLPDLLLRRLGQ